MIEWFRAWKQARRERNIFEVLYDMAMLDTTGPCAICEDCAHKCICGQLDDCGPDCD
jgi:predicted metal-binding protein